MVYKVTKPQPGVLLDPKPSQALRNHSPCGFEWGYCGSGPAQLALALLLDATGDPDLSLALYQDFKFTFVAGFPKDAWDMTQDEILAWCEAMQDYAPGVRDRILQARAHGRDMRGHPRLFDGEGGGK